MKFISQQYHLEELDNIYELLSQIKHERFYHQIYNEGQLHIQVGI